MVHLQRDASDGLMGVCVAATGERSRIDIANWFIMICKWHQHNISSSTSSHTLGGGGGSSKHKQRAMMMNLRRRMIRDARQQTRYAARCFRIHGAITNQMHARRHNVITICRARLILPTSQWQSRPRPNVILLSHSSCMLYNMRLYTKSWRGKLLLWKWIIM